MVLSPSQAKRYYDRFGSKQDSQAFYEDPALDDLIAHAGFDRAERVFELGCGTGRLAARLLAEHLPASSSYLGVDLSPTMIDLAGRRLAQFAGRAEAVISEGSMSFPAPDRSADRFVSTYVLDLLSAQDIRAAISEAHRVLKPGGKLCLASLTCGVTLASRMVSTLWSAVFRLRASLVGGCRPIRLEQYLDGRAWSVDYRNVVTPFGVPSEVIVAASISKS
jgi:ubiquinone/menaquinone biosynthesis C-methylase UbiE